MIEWLAVILLISVGIGLIIAEVMFIPGTTVVGFLGLVFVVTGIIISFLSFDKTTGFVVLGVSVAGGLTALFIGFKSKAWEKFSLNSSINSKFNQDREIDLRIGDKGTALSALRPMGKAEFKEQIFEVTTQGNYLNPGSKIRIIQLSESKIIVEPLNE
jgi:membrane-bound ClpP family serine protease